MQWFKFYGQDWLTDTKIISMKIEDRLCFISLLCLASQNEGLIKKCNEETIIQLTHLPFDPYDENNEYTRAKGFLKRLNDNEMITMYDNGDVLINNFMKRQSLTLTGYERVKRYREKQKEYKKSIENKGDNTNDNEMITNDNANDNTRKEKKRKEKKRIKEEIVDKSPTPLEEAKNFFINEELQTKAEDYAISKNIPKEEIKKFILYWTEPNKTGKKQRWENQTNFEIKRRLLTWFSNYEKFTKNSNSKNKWQII